MRFTIVVINGETGLSDREQLLTEVSQIYSAYLEVFTNCEPLRIRVLEVAAPLAARLHRGRDFAVRASRAELWVRAITFFKLGCHGHSPSVTTQLVASNRSG